MTARPETYRFFAANLLIFYNELFNDNQEIAESDETEENDENQTDETRAY